MAQIIDDIVGETYLRGTAKGGTDNAVISRIYATMDTENKWKIQRSVNKAVQALKVALGEYLSSGMSSDNKVIEETSAHTLVLDMPDNFNDAATPTITASAHDYIVNTAIGDWYVTTNPEDAKDAYQLAADALATLRIASSLRRRPKRPE